MPAELQADAAQAAERELLEEVGFPAEQTRKAGIVHLTEPPDELYFHVFNCHYTVLPKVHLSLRELSDFAWVTNSAGRSWVPGFDVLWTVSRDGRS